MVRPSTCSLKTSQHSLTRNRQMFSRCPKAGMTRNGSAYLRAPLVPRTTSQFIVAYSGDERRKGHGKRYRGSREFRVSNRVRGIRTGEEELEYLTRSIEWLMGFPAGGRLIGFGNAVVPQVARMDRTPNHRSRKKQGRRVAARRRQRKECARYNSRLLSTTNPCTRN